jgi:hypothetical protein
VDLCYIGVVREYIALRGCYRGEIGSYLPTFRANYRSHLQRSSLTAWRHLHRGGTINHEPWNEFIWPRSKHGNIKIQRNVNFYLKTLHEAHNVGQMARCRKPKGPGLDWPVGCPDGGLLWPRQGRQCNRRVALYCPYTLGTMNWAESDTRTIRSDDGSPLTL